MTEAAAWPFEGLRRKHYGVVLADPPWNFATYSAKGHKKTPHAHYRCMSIQDIKNLPVGELAAPDCALFMWATQAMIPEAMDTMGAWGFKFTSMGTWAKQSSTGKKWAFGTGYRFRSAAEFYILAMRGNLKQSTRSVRNLIVAPVREHSRKPDELREDIEKMFPGVPSCELFGRAPAAGWDVWGNQTDLFPAKPADPAHGYVCNGLEAA